MTQDAWEVQRPASQSSSVADTIRTSPHGAARAVVNGKAHELDHGDYKDHPALYGYVRDFRPESAPSRSPPCRNARAAGLPPMGPARSPRMKYVPDPTAPETVCVNPTNALNNSLPPGTRLACTIYPVTGPPDAAVHDALITEPLRVAVRIGALGIAHAEPTVTVTSLDAGPAPELFCASTRKSYVPAARGALRLAPAPIGPLKMFDAPSS